MSSVLDVFNFEYNGHHLVEAGAGTGKTYNIAALYVRALVEKRLSPTQILVLTFTNDATSELKSRLRERVSELIDYVENSADGDDFIKKLATKVDNSTLTHLKNCLFQFDEAAISTIHGFCQKLLSEKSVEFEVVSNFELESNYQGIIQDAADIFWEEEFFRSEIKSDFEEWSRNHLNIEYQSPDKLLELIKPLILNPDINVEIGDVNTDDLESNYTSCISQYQKLKDSFKNDEDEIKSIFNSKALNGSKYRNKEQLLAEFELWITQDFECPKTYPGLIKFGSYLPEQGIKKDFEKPDLNIFRDVDNYIAEFEQLNRVNTWFIEKAITRIREIVNALKRKRRVLWYQDLLSSVREGLNKSDSLAKSLANRFPLAFIDEFQDTDNVQYSIFNSIYKDQHNSCLVMIGDPKQAIYRFRGADIKTYLAAKRETDTSSRYSLRYNYRSSSKLIKAVNSFFDGVEDSFQLSGLDFQPALFPEEKTDSMLTVNGESVAPLTLIRFDTDEKSVHQIREEITKSVSSEIVKILENRTEVNGKAIQQNNISVLVDTHRNAQTVQESLWKYGLRSIIRSKESVFNTLLADHLYRVLAAILHPSNTGYIKSALLTKMLGFNAQDVIALNESEHQWSQIQSSFFELQSNWQKKGISSMFSLMENQFDVLKHIVSNNNPERFITDYKHLKELLINAERKDSLSMFAVLRYFRSKRDEDGFDTSDEELIRLESDDQLIQIVTLHASKGLEYPVVFCPFLWDFKIKTSRIPVVSDGHTQSGYINSNSDQFDDALEKIKSEEEAEKIRLIYVALTRAREMCFVYHKAGIKIKNHSGFDAIHQLIKENSQLENNDELILRKGIEFGNKKISLQSSENYQSSITKDLGREDLHVFNRQYSFSSIASGASASSTIERWGFDFDEDPRIDEIGQIVSLDRFSLPKGKETGNLLHAIFEGINFSDSTTFQPTIDSIIEKTGFDEKWKKCIYDLINDSVSHSLRDNVSLSRISEADRLVEMEFFYPISHLKTDQVFTLIGSTKPSEKVHLLGFMKGFIDLIFRLDGKYYILDYKSNHLGDTFESYSEENLKQEVQHSNYDLQYHIYLIAFLRFIQLKDPNFDYKENFGGVFYLFVRGINPNIPGSGVYFDKPEYSIIKQLDDLMKGAHN